MAYAQKRRVHGPYNGRPELSKARIELLRLTGDLDPISNHEMWDESFEELTSSRINRGTAKFLGRGMSDGFLFGSTHRSGEYMDLTAVVSCPKLGLIS